MVTPVEFFETVVLPRLSWEAVYADVTFAPGSGVWRRGGCPLHDGDDPNFAVNTVTLRYHCHSHCGGGSVEDFANGGTRATGGDYVESVRKLALLAGVDDGALRGADATRAAGAPSRERVLDAVLDLARQTLLGEFGAAGREHLARVLPKDVSLGDLDFGVFPAQATLREALLGQQFTVEEINAAGVLVDRRWEGRLIGGWRDRRGALRSLFARDLSGASGAGQKYLLLKGTKKTELVAYGLDVALTAYRRRPGDDSMIAVEGYFDALVPQLSGLLPVAAIGGNFSELSRARLRAIHGLGVAHLVVVPDFDPKPAACEVHDREWCEPCAPGAKGAAQLSRTYLACEETPELFVVPPRCLYEAAGAPSDGSSPRKVDPADLVALQGVDVLRALVSDPVHGLRYLADHLISCRTQGASR